MDVHRFTLSFTRVTCQRCGIERIRGVQCPDCGRRPEPWEIDQGRNRRQALATALGSLLSAAPRTASIVRDRQSPLEQPGRVASWLAKFWEALHAASETEFRSTAALTEAVEDLVELRSGLRDAQPTPPFGTAIRLAKLMAESAAVMVQRYLDALGAATPIDAQKSAKEAQDALDDLSELAGKLSDWLERQEKVSEAATVQESLGALVADSMEAVGAESLLRMAEANQHFLSSQLGLDCDLDAAVDYGTSAAFADLFLSRDAFVAKVCDVFEVLSAPAPALDVMLSDPVFQADLARLQLELFDSGIACQRSLADAMHTRQESRAVVDLHASLVEAAGLVLSLPLLIAVGQKSAAYGSLRHGDASDHLRKAQANDRLAGVLSGFDHHLRHAQAHRGITYGDEALTTDLRSGSRAYPYDELVSVTFEALESMLAGFVALKLACASRSIDLGGESGLQSLGFTVADIADFMFGAFGFPDRVVAADGDCLHIQLGRPSLTGVTVAVGATLAAVDPSSLESISITVEGGTTWCCPTRLYTGFRHASDDFAKQVMLMRIQVGWKSDDGDPWADSRVVTKWVATQVTETMSLPTTERFHRLRTLREFAVDAGQPELEAMVRGFVAWTRLQVLEMPSGEAERQVLAQVIECSTLDVDFDLA